VLFRSDARPEGFSWIDANDTTNNVLSFIRLAGDGDLAGASSPASDGARPGAGKRAADGVLACVVNFSGVPHHNYRIGLPRSGRWRELINTDADTYGGSGVGNYGAVHATDEPWHGMPASAVLTIPPLGALWLTPDPEPS